MRLACPIVFVCRYQVLPLPLLLCCCWSQKSMQQQRRRACQAHSPALVLFQQHIHKQHNNAARPGPESSENTSHPPEKNAWSAPRLLFNVAGCGSCAGPCDFFFCVEMDCMLPAMLAAPTERAAVPSPAVPSPAASEGDVGSCGVSRLLAAVLLPESEGEVGCCSCCCVWALLLCCRLSCK